MTKDKEKESASMQLPPPPPHPNLSYIEASPPLRGQSLYLGGELGPDGNIYCIPGHANRVLAIYPKSESKSKSNINSSANDNERITSTSASESSNTNSIAEEKEDDDEQDNNEDDKEKCIQIGPEFVGKFKWLRGIRACNGIIYGLPCHADSILRIDAKGSNGNGNVNGNGADVKISTIPIPYETFYKDDTINGDNTNTDVNTKIKSEKEMKWKYHGGAISPIDNCIYCIPQSASHVLKIDPNVNNNDNNNDNNSESETETVSFIGQELPGKYKWYGGLVGPSDGAIYGIPQNSGSVLRICPNAKSSANDNSNSNNNADISITLHGSFDTNHAWHGGGLSSDGTIVCIPNNADTVLLIKPPQLLPTTMKTTEDENGNDKRSFDNCNSTSTSRGDSKSVKSVKHDKMVAEPELCIIGGPDVIATGKNAGRLDRKYKYLGSASDENCNVYCFPSGAEHVLRVNTSTMNVDEIGPSLWESKLERLKQNKWQNGFYCPTDKCVYGIPLAAETVLKIDLNNRRYNSTCTKYGNTETDIDNVIDDRCKQGSEKGEVEPLITTMGLPLEPYGGLAKWEGGVMTEDGRAMYCMPNNFKRVLKITPTGAERTNALR